MKHVVCLVFILLSCNYLFAQQQVVLDNHVFISISNNANVVLDNANSNALLVNTTGNIISEGENNVLKWMLQNNTGNYVVPFATASFSSIPFQLNITTAGSGSNASILFSTYQTITDKNNNYPSDVTNLNSNCRDSVGLFAIDRFWRIDAQNYTVKPTPIISFGYDNSVNELGGANTIIESKLKAMRFNGLINSWETPQKMYGITNTVSKTINTINVNPNDFYKSWTLVDSSIMSIPITLTALNNNTFCVGGSVTITPSGATSYTLLPNNTTSASAFSVMPNASTVYTITGSIGTGSASCSSNSSNSPTVSVVVNALPVISSSVTNITCFGGNTGSVIALVSGSATYTWSNGSHGSYINGLFAGNYSLTVQDDNMCVSNYTVSVTQPTSAINVVVTNQTNVLCYGQSNGAVSVFASGGVPNYVYIWQPNSVFGSSLINLSSGNYSLQVSDANGCKTQSVITISQPVEALQSLITDSVKATCGNNNGSLFASTAGGTQQYNYLWLPVYNTSNNLQNASSGNYTLYTTDGNGCQDTLTVFLGCDLPIKVPQLFSPNADGKNDYFVIEGLENFPNNHISIYNRWGNLIYEKENYQNNWNGSWTIGNKTTKGILPAATYFIVLDFGVNASLKPYTGYVEIMY